MRTAERRLAAEIGRDPTLEELAKYVDMEPEKIEELRSAERVPVSLETPVGDEGETELGSLIPADGPGPLEEVALDARGAVDPPRARGARPERARDHRAALRHRRRGSAAAARGREPHRALARGRAQARAPRPAQARRRARAAGARRLAARLHHP